ncbi:MAG TPA: cell division protein FtsZ [Methanothermobacter sp.]|uniref:Cell division protein FtsZ n=1 Tax=Methanothermobacter tenebrarum TaxID=680118 RepID=A0ABN6PCT4_9EURY|nr:cell division protein FtsZ [Methanothermobacter tenebrarum]MDD3454049.1 cell division protein FtsZ [Methanobacteriales archaeon]MDI6882113.1 cell division protein FtsZ [Methanothermobacter sp.]MDX9692819.1 cell division protein FtsZ [Methanothermobacter sp.]BDH80037.1 cell division protein FtsZ [Methanothermobacter tenebrarum]HHW16409.1 cell division protein FtsZ [Methanothermobacter sp.]
MKFINEAIKEDTIKKRKPAPTPLDEDLKEIIKESRAKIYVVGTGGAGNNTITRLNEIGIEGAETIAINTDAQDLYYTLSSRKLLIGRSICNGLGAGGVPEIGEECAEESEDEIRRELEGADMVFVTCGLGGGTGTGSAPIICKLSKKIGALTIAVVTLPFSAEGLKRRENAEMGLEKLQNAADTVIVIPNDKLLEVAPNLPINKAFMVADEILGRAVKGITELITKPALVSLDLSDVKSIMKGSGMAIIGMGESESGDRALESVHEALNSPLLDLDISNGKGALINIAGSSDLTLQEAENIVQVVAEELDPDANIIWGAQIQDELQNMIRTTIIVAGVKSPYIYGSPTDKDIASEMKKEKKSVDDSALEEFIDGVF